MASLKYLWLGALLALAFVTALWPELDLRVTEYFYNGEIFPWRTAGATNFVHDIATGWVPKLLGIVCIIGFVAAFIRKTSWRPWAFLLLALLLGPGLLANAVLKDNWGRSRPTQLSLFGSDDMFTPYWQPGIACNNNCSFVNGDGAFGFMLAAPALVLRRRRLWFWAGTGAGVMFGVTRIMMGAHFLSDTVWSALLMLGVMFGLYALLYGRAAARQAWQEI